MAVVIVAVVLGVVAFLFFAGLLLYVRYGKVLEAKFVKQKPKPRTPTNYAYAGPLCAAYSPGEQFTESEHLSATMQSIKDQDESQAMLSPKVARTASGQLAGNDTTASAASAAGDAEHGGCSYMDDCGIIQDPDIMNMKLGRKVEESIFAPPSSSRTKSHMAGLRQISIMRSNTVLANSFATSPLGRSRAAKSPLRGMTVMGPQLICTSLAPGTPLRSSGDAPGNASVADSSLALPDSPPRVRRKRADAKIANNPPLPGALPDTY
eukprot:TRINITY_DN1928_c2_g1_i1.p1 TRINITY_DN1928_c2_g1~~TRINITY_DN1928_c2_g1_i1.p1  ORF type:complete len:265 (+),score=4.58 TRINITY_DN1928_c2_g1_i1:36-830(+)